MKIDLTTIDQTQFMMHSHVLNGEVVFLIQPQHIGAKFSQANKIFRSSLWDSEGNAVSFSFPKFVNWGENPENFPVPNSLKNCTVVEKIDGSALIISKRNGHFILRTRGTVDASKMDNGHELEIFKQRYPEVFNFQPLSNSWDFSLVFEWYSPLNKIVIRYSDEPIFTLIGAVHHADYRLWTQEWLDILAKQFGCPRPETYKFTTIEDLLSNVEAWKGREGVCVYSQDGQAIHKCKSSSYLILHRMKEELSSLERVVDAWFEQGKMSFMDFQSWVTGQFDWEIWFEIRGDVSRICDGWKEVLKIIDYMKEFTAPLRNVPRKIAAEKILSAYGTTNRASFCFSILDGKELGPDQEKKLMWQVLKR